MLFRSLFSRRYRSVVMLSVVTVIMSVVGYLSVRSVARNADEHIAAHLQLILDGTTKMIRYGFESVTAEAEGIATSVGVREALSRLRAGDNAGAADHLKQTIAEMARHRYFFGLVVTSDAGELVVTSHDVLAAYRGQFVFPHEQDDIQAGRARLSLPLHLPGYVVPQQRPSFGRAHRDEVSRVNKDLPLGVAVLLAMPAAPGEPAYKLWMIYNARELFASVLQPGRSGSTGEIYAFDRNGWMLSDSRFNEHLYDIGLLKAGEESSMRIQVLDPAVNLLKREKRTDDEPLEPTRAVQSALADGEGVSLKPFRDYRGVPVIGAWEWFSDYGFGITHEIDYAEAYQHVRVLFYIVIGLVCLLFVTTIASAVASHHAWDAEDRRVKSEQRLKELQGEIAHVNRLATMGEMATGLAHELNQPLAAATNYARAAINLLNARAPSAPHAGAAGPDRLPDFLENIEHNTLKCGEIIKRLRKFVSHEGIETSALPLGRIVSDPLKLMAPDLKKLKVAVNVQIAQDLPSVAGDEVQLQQVVLNLVRNSIDAMRKKGGAVHSLTLRGKVDQTAKKVSLDVTDTGGGIDPKVKPRLFEQFNSSSPGGMGLGLAISRTIIEAHGGCIDVVTESERGTTFRIELPAAEAS